MRSRRAGLGGVLVLALVACSEAPSGEVTLLPDEGAIELSATVNRAGFARGEMAGYHLLVARNGSAAGNALLVADVTDVAVLDALEQLGAVPGDNLDIDTWEQRHDPHSWKPDQVVQGPMVEILVRLRPGSALLPLDQVLEDSAGLGFVMRFGGNRRNIPTWRSGCVACLYSCPGGKVSNARYTVRDFVDETTRFTPRPDVLPADGKRVTVRLQLVPGSADRP